MRSIFLSFSPEWYSYIEDGRKIYEHRKRFCNEPVIAYLYLGLPVQQIIAILELGQRIDMNNWLEEYKEDPEAIKRISDSLTRNRYAMEIKKVQFIEPIGISEVIEVFPQFHIPQSYFYLDNKPEVFDFIKSKIKMKWPEIINNFDNISSDLICRY